MYKILFIMFLSTVAFGEPLCDSEAGCVQLGNMAEDHAKAVGYYMDACTYNERSCVFVASEVSKWIKQGKHPEIIKIYIKFLLKINKDKYQYLVHIYAQQFSDFSLNMHQEACVLTVWDSCYLVAGILEKTQTVLRTSL